MAKRIVGVVVVLVIAYVAYLGYQRYKANAQSESGAILTDDGSRASDGSSSSESEPVTRPTPAVQTPAQTVATPATLPASDSLSPNPTNGTAFTGAGKFQVYRQGNLTWRVDTETGHTCVLFASMEEWRKPIVYSHGCNNS